MQCSWTCERPLDTVDHSVILPKLSSMGVVDLENDWFADYLRDRIQIVEDNNGRTVMVDGPYDVETSTSVSMIVKEFS